MASLSSNVNAQSYCDNTIFNEQVSGTSYQFDLGELYSWENYDISMSCTSWLPWGYDLYKKNPNSATGFDLVNDGWFWLGEDIKEINISASSSGSGHYYLLIASCSDIGLVLTSGIATVVSTNCIGTSTTWNIRVIKQTDTRAIPYWIQLGKDYSSQGEYETAIFCCNYVIKLDPRNSIAMNLKGIALTELNEYNEAVSCFENATSIDPSFAEAWKNKGVALSKQIRHRDAVAAINKAVEINPGYADAWILLGDEFYTINDCENATIAFEHALNLNREFRNIHGPSMSNAWYCWGRNLSDEDRHCDAANAFAKATSLNRWNVAAQERKISSDARCHALQPLANGSRNLTNNASRKLNTFNFTFI